MGYIKIGNILHLRKVSWTSVLVLIMLVSVLGVPMLSLIRSVLAQPTTVLTHKWTTPGLGTNWEGGLVIGDVTGDGQEDVVYAGQLSGGSNDRVYVLDGDNGDTLASYTNERIGTYCQPQLYDVDRDGVLDILVPLYYQPGLAAYKYTGSSTLTQLWSVNTQGSSGSGSVMAKPVAGDIDNDGHLDIFIASQDVSPGDNSSGTYYPNGYDGTIVRLDDNGTILYTTFTWRACSGGLSLADTDNDGVFELYQGDRQAMSSPSRSGYSDGGYGKGVRSFWADNLTERWNRLDFLSSSQSPVLVDVNGDGILDVLAGMYNEMNILNSTNGEMIQRWSTGRNDPISMSVHYGFTVFDIDDDGHLELFCSDGDHDDDPYVDVYDLVTGEFDAQLSLAGGDWKWGPTIADISTSYPGMEIICAPNGTSINGWRGVLMIYNSDFESIQNVTASMSVQLGYPFVQDIDGDTFLEVVVCASSGSVYAFDTAEDAPAPTGSKRIRSEVTYFGERRLGVAEHTIMPWGDDYWTAPLVAPVSPGDNALAVPVSTDHLDFKLREHQSEPLTYTVTTSPNIGSDSGSNTSNSYNWTTYSLNLTESLDYDTTYRWTVSASDGVNSTVRTYTFRTELEPSIGNIPPSQGNPSLVSLDGLNSTTSTFICYNQSTTDSNGDDVTNIYRWLVEDEPLAQLLLPFDTRNETLTKDYSGYGNDGVIKGAVWVPDGIMGGAYMFDGKDDAIIVSDGGLGYFNDQNYGNNSEELGGYGNWNEITVEAWIYLTEYNNGSKVVAKVPSYALGFYSGYTSRLYAAVWPYTGYVDPDNDNQNAEDREQTVSADVDIDLNTWYHIAFTYENGVGLRLYFNGELVAERSASEGLLSRSRGEPLYIGRLVQPFAGMIDDVRIYSYAQPEEQIYNRYMESKDGNSSSSLFMPMGIGFTGAELECQIIPTDSFDEGTVASAAVILRNSPPTASNLELYPVRDRHLRLDDEDLVVGYEYFDPDGDAEGSSEIEWFKNNVPQPAFENETAIPAAITVVGQEWNCTVTPQDSAGDFGAPITSYTVTIRDNAVPSTGTPDLVSSGGADREDEDLIASAVGSSDVDGDAVTNIYRWIVDGAPWMNLLVPFDTEVPLSVAANGTTLDYSGWGNDGTVVGARWVADGIVGGAFRFDGDDFIRVAESGDSLGGDGSWSQISVEFWVKATGTSSTEAVVLKHDFDFSTGGRDENPYGVGYLVEFRARSDEDRFYWSVFNDTGVAEISFRDYENVGAWHHVVCTYESGVGLRLYVDGIERASMAFAGNINATLDGILDIGSTDFSGLLDEVRIYPFVLSGAQIFQRFIETKDGLSSSSTIVAQETIAGDDWLCTVIPSDSWDDGVAKGSTTLHVSAVPPGQNSRPRIDLYSPTELALEVAEGENLNFTQFSSDPDGDLLSYAWLLDDVEQASTQNWTYAPGFGEAETHNVTLVVDDGEFSDSQEWSVTVNIASGFHDVAITNISVIDTVVGQGYCARINVTIENLGAVAESFNVTCYVNGTLIDTTTVSLQNGSSTATMFIWNSTGYGKGNYPINVTASQVPGETNLSNNNLTAATEVFVTIPGDVDGDGDVDIYDAVKITSIYSSEIGDLDYKPNSDMNADGVIDNYDVAICTSHYRQSS
jgi:hypothetical protein